MPMNIGETIRTLRIQNGLSQGDIERRTGLKRSYQSRVENDHTLPSLDTLAKISQAIEVPLAQLFASSSGPEEGVPPPSNSEEQFMTEFRRYSFRLNQKDRSLILDMVKKMRSRRKHQPVRIGTEDGLQVAAKL